MILFARIVMASLMFTAATSLCIGGEKISVMPLPPETRAALTGDTPTRFVLVDKDWFNWGSSVIKSEDGKYHMFYARWPKKLNFTAWLPYSEIAHAVADKPEGPFRFIEVAIPSRDPERGKWFTAHNPKIKKFGNKYYLYFIRTFGEKISDAKRREISLTGYHHPKWKELRKNQRTFVAVSDSLNGPWKVTEKPIVEPAKTITTLTVNPAVCQGPDGKFFMIVKGDKPNEKRFIRNQALATAPKPEGPWTIYDKPVIDYLDTEDVSMWYDKIQKKFFAVYHGGPNIGLIVSDDGYNWRKSNQDNLTKKIISFSDGSSWKPSRMERPFVLTDKQGRAQVLYVACKYGKRSSNIAIPLKIEAPNKK
jgi:hypothetical protein